MRKGAPYVEGSYNDIDPGLNPALQDHYRITPSPGGPGDQYGRWTRDSNKCDPRRLARDRGGRANSILEPVARPRQRRDRDQIASRAKATGTPHNSLRLSPDVTSPEIESAARGIRMALRRALSTSFSWWRSQPPFI